MAMTTYTTEHPIEPGWYWYHEDDTDLFDDEICRVTRSLQGPLMACFVDGGHVALTSLSGRWKGPLQP